AIVGSRQPRLRRVTPAQDRMTKRNPGTRLVRAMQRGSGTEHDARREVLDLALAVDGRIGHDRDGLVQVVGEIRPPFGQRCQRTVIAERPDQLVRGLRHEPRLLQVIGLETEGRELLLAPDRDVLDLVGRNGDLPTGRDATAFATDPAGVRKWPAWPAAGEVRARIVAIGAARAPRREESPAQSPVLEGLPSPAPPA